MSPSQEPRPQLQPQPQPFPFLLLPPELRLMVYQYTFPRSHPCLTNPTGGHVDPRAANQTITIPIRTRPWALTTLWGALGPHQRRASEQTHTALLRTCRTIQAEATPSLYATNLVVFAEAWHVLDSYLENDAFMEHLQHAAVLVRVDAGHYAGASTFFAWCCELQQLHARAPALRTLRIYFENVGCVEALDGFRRDWGLDDPLQSGRLKDLVYEISRDVEVRLGFVDSAAHITF
jgi:hypothetical protein